jgi:hypothetical protein
MTTSNTAVVQRQPLAPLGIATHRTVKLWVIERLFFTNYI